MAVNYAELAKQHGGKAVSGGATPAPGKPSVANYADLAKQLGGSASAAPTTKPEPAPKKNFLQKTAGFLGIEKFGQGIASTIRTATGEVQQDINTQNQSGDNVQKLLAAAKTQTDPAKKKRLLDMAQQMGANIPTATDIDSGLNLSNREILGSAANVGLNIFAGGQLSTGVKAGGLTRQLAPELASALNKSAKGVKALGQAGGLTGSVARNSALGGAFGLAGGMNQNLSGSDLTKSTLGGAAIGGVIPLASKGASKVKNFFTQELPEKMYNKAVKPTLDELRKNVRFGNDTLGRQLLDEKVYGRPGKLLDIAQKQLESSEDELQTILKGSKAKITKSEVRPYLDKLKEQYKNTPGMKSEISKIDKVIRELPNEFSVSKANTIKRDLYKTVNDIGYKLDSNNSTKREAQKQMAKGLKTLIEDKTEKKFGTRVMTLNKKLSIYGRLQDRATDILAKESKNLGVGFADLLLGGLPSVAGSPLVGGALVGARHLMNSPTALTTGAHALNSLNRLPSVPPALGRLGKQAILNAP